MVLARSAGELHLADTKYFLNYLFGVLLIRFRPFSEKRPSCLQGGFCFYIRFPSESILACRQYASGNFDPSSSSVLH